MKLTLLIDDLRDIDVDVIARNGKAGLVILDLIRVDVLYLDHDLGPDSISGYTVAMKALDLDIMPPTVILVTSNPVGRDNIIAGLKQFGYTNNTGNTRRTRIYQLFSQRRELAYIFRYIT